MPHRVEYKPLANYIGQMELRGTVADLVVRCERYEGANDPDWWAGVICELRTLPQEAEMMVGVYKLCDAMKVDNPRFQPGLFLDWVCERL